MRKPALIAATLALAITPALTAVAPAHAAPRVPLAAAEELSLVEQILAAFPEPMAAAARLVLAGQFDQIFVLFGEALKLTPTQITTIIATLQALLGQFGGEVPPTTETPTTDVPTTTAVQNKKVAWTVDSLLKNSSGKKSGPVLGNVLLNAVLAAK
ncbi:hypothetical protein [Actinocorallia longicatena]|uniref:Secreted protein n=1 Tax=Actinocorallia longicatena TaxID=111803 RepID=A0ABP6Q232_9ACTN